MRNFDRDFSCEPEISSREELAQVALVQFLEHGYHCVSLRRIADAANVKHGSIHKLSGGKENLLFELLREAAVTTCDNLTLATPRNLESVKAVEIFVAVHLQFGVKYRKHSLLARREMHLLRSDMQATLREVRDRKVTRLWEIISVGQSKQVFKTEDARFAAKVIVGALEEVVDNKTISDSKIEDSIRILQRMALRFAAH
jgi:AcrR family transcriptional regulator